MDLFKPARSVVWQLCLGSELRNFGRLGRAAVLQPCQACRLAGLLGQWVSQKELVYTVVQTCANMLKQMGAPDPGQWLYVILAFLHPGPRLLPTLHPQPLNTAQHLCETTREFPTCSTLSTRGSHRWAPCLDLNMA